MFYLIDSYDFHNQKTFISLIILGYNLSHHYILSLFLRQYNAINPMGSSGLNKSTCLSAPSSTGNKCFFRYS